MIFEEPISSEELGALIRRLRRERKMTIEGLARASDLTLGYIHSIEKGVRSPSLSTLRKIARGMDMSVRDLLGGHEERFSKEAIEFAVMFDRAPEAVQLAVLTLLRQRSGKPPPKPPDECA